MSWLWLITGLYAAIVDPFSGGGLMFPKENVVENTKHALLDNQWVFVTLGFQYKFLHCWIGRLGQYDGCVFSQ